jgi:Tfp pilus assembly protein PilV
VVTRRAAPAGHSIPELIVALTFLAAALAAVTSSTLLASRWTTDAVLRQRALSAAEAALDSITARPDLPSRGSHSSSDPPWTTEWEVVPLLTDDGAVSGYRSGSALVRVTVTLEGALAPAAELLGLWINLPPGPLP